MLTVYIGATFNLGGVLQRDGTPSDFTGWTLAAALYDQSGTNLISSLTVTFVDISKGVLTLTAPDTSSWSAGKARIDLKLTSPVGDVVLGPPTYLRIEQSPLS